MNKLSPMLVIEFGILIVLREAQFSNALSPIDVTELGISIHSKDVQP